MLESEKVSNIDVVIIKIKEEKYLLEVKDVKEIFVPRDMIVPVPLADRNIVGVINIRGILYTIVSLRQKVYRGENSYNLNDESRILLLELENNLNIAILVDSVIGVRKLPISIFETKSTIVETQIDYQYIKSLGVLDDDTYILLNLDALINPKALAEIEMPSPYQRDREKATTTKTTASKSTIEEREEVPRLPSVEDLSTDTVEVKVKQTVRKATKEIHLSSEQEDLLKEIGNIGSGNAITALSRLIKKKVDVDLTKVGIVSFDQFSDMFGGSDMKVCGIFSRMEKPTESTILQAFELRPLMKIVASLAGKDSKIDPDKVNSKGDLDDFAVSTIQEMGNIMAGHYVSALADLTGTKMMIELPEFEVSEAGLLEEFLRSELESVSSFIVAITTSMKVVDLMLKGVFFFIPDIETLSIIFEKLGFEQGSLEVAKLAMKKPIDLKSLNLTEIQRDALQEVGNMGAGNAANALAKMINKRVDIDIPAVEMVKLDEFANKISKRNEKMFVAWSNILGKTRATILSIFRIADILKITSIITDDKKKISAARVKSIDDFDELFKSAINEICHILASHYVSALGDLLNIRMMTEPPDMSIDVGKQLFNILKDEIGLLRKLSLVITSRVIIADIKITGTFLYIPDIETLQDLLNALSKFYE